MFAASTAPCPYSSLEKSCKRASVGRRIRTTCLDGIPGTDGELEKFIETFVILKKFR